MSVADMNESTSAQPGAAAPVVARVAKISLSDYRAFPCGLPYEFDLGPEGKNLLLYGENGSGKTSLFRALRDLMAVRPGPTKFADLRNVFAPGEEGFISVKLSAGTPNEFSWEYGNEHPRGTGGQPYNQFAERCCFLDYKALLEINFVHKAVTPNLFSILIEEVLRDLVVFINGKQHRLYDVYKRTLDFKPADHREKWKLEAVDSACKNLSSALANHLPEVVKEGNRLIKKMDFRGYEFDLRPDKIIYDHVKRDFVGRKIMLSAKLFGKPIDHPEIFMNEARLTALALAIYFGAAKLVVKAIPANPDGTTMVRLMVLDDILIGLDLANRLPVLRVLNDEFKDWQIILMTYDKTWFDLAKEFTEHLGCWTSLSLKDLTADLGQPCRPYVEQCPDLLQIAQNHLKAGDLMATAVYLRAVFEVRLKKVCESNGIKVCYKCDPKNMKIDQLWQGIVERQKERESSRQIDFIEPRLMQDVETVRSTVLNKLSHSGAPQLFEKEVRFALETVEKFQHYVFNKVQHANS